MELNSHKNSKLQWTLFIIVVGAVGLLLLNRINEPEVVSYGLSGKAAVNTYYVSTTGNDINPGSELQPFRTIQKAADNAVAGSVVIVLSGEYNEQVVLKNSGSAGNEIVFKGSGRQAKVLHGFNITGRQYRKCFCV